MPMEKEGFRDQLERLTTRFEGREAITVDEVCELIGCHRDTLIRDKKFPKKKIGVRYVIPLVALARWMS
jgi:excisionase family DNA binding protein